MRQADRADGLPELQRPLPQGALVLGSTSCTRAGSGAPACRRIQDHHPAGVIALQGSVVAPLRDEVEGLMLNVVREKVEASPKRIIGIATDGDGLRVSTTRSKLARTECETETDSQVAPVEASSMTNVYSKRKV